MPESLSPADGSLDRVEIRGLRIVAFCGVLPLEQEQRQPFRIDLDLYVDLRLAGASDDLAETVHYGTVTDRLLATLGDERYNLVERMAQRAADVALEDPLVTAVTVTVAKIRPPIAADVDTTGVRIHRRRS